MINFNMALFLIIGYYNPPNRNEKCFLIVNF